MDHSAVLAVASLRQLWNLSRVLFQVKFVESHAGVSDATAAFVRFAIAAGAMLPFADWAEKEVLFAGQSQKYGNTSRIDST